MGNHKTFSEESENPPATKDPSCDIEVQFKLTEDKKQKYLKGKQGGSH